MSADRRPHRAAAAVQGDHAAGRHVLIRTRIGGGRRVLRLGGDRHRIGLAAHRRVIDGQAEHIGAVHVGGEGRPGGRSDPTGGRAALVAGREVKDQENVSRSPSASARAPPFKVTTLPVATFWSVPALATGAVLPESPPSPEGLSEPPPAASSQQYQCNQNKPPFFHTFLPRLGMRPSIEREKVGSSRSINPPSDKPAFANIAQ